MMVRLVVLLSHRDAIETGKGCKTPVHAVLRSYLSRMRDG